jgi:hypothetical protein
MNLQENISTQLRRRTHLLDRVIKNLLPNMYPCDYNSSDHFVEGVLDEIRWFLLDVEELQGIERADIVYYIIDYKYDELTEYFNERCIVLQNDNLQETIRRILREESKPILMIRRRVPYDDLEREFSESLDMSSNMLRNTNKEDGSIMSLNRFIDVTISILMDGIHYELYSTMPEDSQWYGEAIESLKDYYKDRIKSRYKKLVSNI